MGLEIVTPPAAALVIEELRTHCRIDGGDEDAYLLALAAAAQEFLERQTRTAFMTTVLRLNLDAFPTESGDINLPKPPLQAVASVQYTDSAGVSRTMDSAAYTVDTTRRPGRISLKPGQSWPATDGSINSVRVNFTAGYTTRAAVPNLLKQAVKLAVGHWYENRETAGEKNLSEIPMAVESIIALHMFPEAV